MIGVCCGRLLCCMRNITDVVPAGSFGFLIVFRRRETNATTSYNEPKMVRFSVIEGSQLKYVLQQLELKMAKGDRLLLRVQALEAASTN